MKINKFLIVGATMVALTLSAHAEHNNTNQQEINPTVATTLSSVGGFFGNLAQGAKFVANTVVDSAHAVANSEVGQKIGDTAVKGANFVANTATDGAHAVANSEVGQKIGDTAVKGANFVANTATDGAHAVAKGYKESTAKKDETSQPTVEAASVTPVNTAESTPSLSEGVSAAKNKIGNMIGFLRDKATSHNDSDSTPKIK